ncbi:MAG: exodeoxyribonuclease V subunit gamma [Myxococcaceae bacterium]|nr:exodeoxyribonuclease V subunit gamma [Myxococcaceae bacterium]
MPAPPRTLFILPDVQRVEAALVARAEAPGFVDARAYLTWSQWLGCCEPFSLKDKPRVDALLGAALVHAQVPAQASLAFAHFAHEPRFAAQAWELIQHLKSQRVTAAKLETAAAEVGGDTGDKALFVAQLWRGYQKALQARAALDGEDVIHAVTAHFEAHWPVALEGVEGLELLHFYDFPPSRMALVLAVARQCAKRQVRLAVEVPGGGPDDIDALANEILTPLEKPSSQWEAQLRKSDEVARGRPLAEVAAMLFSSAQGEVPAPGLSVLACATPRDELKETARGIRQRIDEGCPPHDIAVAARDLGPFAEQLVEQLAEYGVPARARRGRPLSGTALGRLALELPRLFEHGFLRADVMRWLEEERFAARFAVPEGALSLLLQAGARDNTLGAEPDRGAYAVRLDALRQRSPENVRGPLRALSGAIERLIRTASTLSEPRTPEAFVDAWWSALETLGLLDVPLLRPSPKAPAAWQRQMHLAAARDAQAQRTLKSLRDALHAVAQTPAFHARRMKLGDWSKWLNHAAQGMALATFGARSGAVTLLDVRELPGRSFRHVWLLGMTEGRFPLERTPQGLLGESERRALNAAARQPLFRLGVTVRTQGMLPLRLAEDRLLFHVALSAAQETVTLSHAATDATGRPVARSSFIDELERRVPTLSLCQVPRRAVVPLGEALSERELQQQVALASVTSAAERLSPLDARSAAWVHALRGTPWLERALALAAQERERLEFHGDETRASAHFSGRVDSALLQKPLAERFRFGPEHPVSASWLETFGNCRFQGFVQRVLLREEGDEAGEDTPVSVHGQLLHRALEYWVQGWKDAPPTEERRLSALDAALRKAADSLQQEQATGHPRLWELTVERSKEQLLRLWHRTQLYMPNGRSEHLTETRFGNATAPDMLTQVMLPAAFLHESPVYLNGEIDRWDKGEQHLVVDYKRAKPGSKPQIYRELGISHFQLPIYLYAVRQVAGPQAQLDAAWLGVRHAQARPLGEVLKKYGQNVHELLATDAPTRERLHAEEKKNLANAVHGLLSQLREGDFGARPQDCRHCTVKSVCRISARVLGAFEGDE